jgi:hypothetical protein
MPEERDEQAETFNQDQQEMFQNPDTSLGETRPRTPGTENFPPTAAPDDEESGGANEPLSGIDERQAQ